MNIADLTQSYAGKTDEELLRLAGQREHLTIEAQSALASELAKRRIEVPPSLATKPAARVVPRAEPVVVAPVPMKTGAFIEEVLRFYARNRWVFIQLIFPAVFLGFVAITFARNEARAIAPVLYPRLSFRTMLLLSTLIRDSGYLTSWLVFCLSFAAVCSAVEQRYAGYVASISDSFGTVLEQFWPFLRLSGLLFGMYFALELLLLGPLSFLVFPFTEKHLGRFSSLQWDFIGCFEVWLIGLVLSHCALAMPAVILDDVSITDSLFLSYKLTRGKFAILAVLLFKGIFVSYVAGWLPFWLARWIPDSVTLPSWFHWLLSGASVLCVTVVEPVMFIGFAMLYLKTTAHASAEADAASA